MKTFATILCVISLILMSSGLYKIFTNNYYGFLDSESYIKNSAQATTFLASGGFILFVSLFIFIICKLEDIRLELNRLDERQRYQTEVIQERHL